MLRFELDRTADFMPRISLTSLGEGNAPIQLSWLPVERAKAYFLHAVQMEAPKEQGVNKASVTVWSSAETAGAGTALVDYLDASRIDRWLKQKVLLPASTTACIVPQGVFDTDKGMASMTMLDMVAYGPEVHLVHPAKPADPKLLAAWKPEWSARVRTKSTANLVLGIAELVEHAASVMTLHPGDVIFSGTPVTCTACFANDGASGEPSAM